MTIPNSLLPAMRNTFFPIQKVIPCIRIVEQPQEKFRFRYLSELRFTHGCLLGKNSTTESRSYPTVELVNYDKRALIRCRLVQHDNSDQHPHRLQVDGQEDVGKEVPERDIYRVSFRGMTIVHTARKEIASILYNIYEKSNNENPDSPIDKVQLWNDCWTKAKKINLNIVRLHFSAHDIETEREICEPVFSEPIHNRKSALKICRMSKVGGHPQGGEEVIMFVEKVSSRHIEVHFVERNEEGKKVWFAKPEFSKDDVHHQYAITFRTPPYRDQQIITNVKVSVMLFRPSDQSYSEPIEFSYYADPFARQAKRKARNPPFSATSIKSDGSHIPDGATGGPGSSTMDAEESLNTQIILIQDDTASEPHQSEGTIQDFDKIWDKHDFTCTMIDLYNMEQILEGVWQDLQEDSGLGAVHASETLAPRDPDVRSEHAVERQSTDERKDTCRGDLLDGLDAPGSTDVLEDVSERTFSRLKRFFAMYISEKMYKYFEMLCSENILILLFLCISFVVAIYLY